MTSTAPQLPAWSDVVPADTDVTVVGGGFSGLMTLVHLCRALPGGRFAVIERRPLPRPGIAYGGCDHGHLLNVPVARMGAFPDDHGAFQRWLDVHRPGEFAGHDFAPRMLFGEYLVETVAGEIARSGARVCLVRDSVVHVEQMPAGVELMLASGRATVARSVVIAPGLPPSRAPWARVDHGVSRLALVANPWEPGAFTLPDQAAEVLVVGSGLTAIDVVQGLRRAGHRGLIRMVSRHGRLPLAHAAPGESPLALPLEHFAGGPTRVLAALRKAARERIAAGMSWQVALDSIRPHVTAIWKSWSVQERRRFLRTARALWEIHRHRAPRQVLADMEAQLAAGTLTLEHGDLAALRPAPQGAIDAEIRSARGGVHAYRVARVFNCIGPGMSVRDTVDPMLSSLLRSGLASADEVGLGLRCDADGRLLDSHGTADERLLLVGALRRGDLWESTAVPELRVQAANAARAAAELVARESPAAAAVSSAPRSPEAGIPAGCG